MAKKSKAIKVKEKQPLESVELNKEKILKFLELQIGKDVMSKLEEAHIEYFFYFVKLYQLNPFKREIYLIPYEIMK